MKKILIIMMCSTLLISFYGCSKTPSSESALSSSSDEIASSQANGADSSNAEKKYSDGNINNVTANEQSEQESNSSNDINDENKLTYNDLLKTKYGTKVTIEGVALNNAFDRAWSGTHYKFDMTFGDTKKVISVDMNYKLKSAAIEKGDRVSITGIVDGTSYSTAGESGLDHQVPNIVLESYSLIY